MKKSLLSLTLVLLLNAPFAAMAQSAFNRGVNLSGWFQSGGPKQIQFTKFTKKDFQNIKSLGCDVVRLPINLHAMTSGAPSYTPDPLFLSFLDQVVDWSEELQIHLIIDNHTFDPAVNTSPDIGDALVKVWKQMAEHYKTRSGLIYYEVLNEPHGITDQVWSAIQQDVIDAIREVDNTHTIIVGASNWNSYNNLKNLPVYSDNNLIYTFHFYDPFLFTHQGAGWVDPSMEPLSGVPFPYNAAVMPQLPQSLKGSWIESAYNNYDVEGTESRVKALIDIAANFKTERNVRIFCGELGALMNNSPAADRVHWYGVVRAYMEQKGIPWTTWDYTGGFGIFEPGGNDLFEYDLNTPLLEALGLNVPEQKEFIVTPDTTGFMIYSDYIGEKMVESGYGGEIDYYSTVAPNNGDYCLQWANAPQYSTAGFDFKPNKDLSTLVENDFAIDFLARGDAAGMSFDIRFIDTKTGPGDHPWRMRVTVDDSKAVWDEKWRHLHIPLKSFAEQGSWDDGAWFNPEGKFDWTAVDRVEIVAEGQSLQNVKFWFDNIYITDQDTAQVHSNKPVVVGLPSDEPDWSTSLKIYPNPADVTSTLIYSLPVGGRIIIDLYNVAGRKVRSLVDKQMPAGNYQLPVTLTDEGGRALPRGLYICRLSSAGFTKAIKLKL